MSDPELLIDWRDSFVAPKESRARFVYHPLTGRAERPETFNLEVKAGIGCLRSSWSWVGYRNGLGQARGSAPHRDEAKAAAEAWLRAAIAAMTSTEMNDATDSR